MEGCRFLEVDIGGKHIEDMSMVCADREDEISFRLETSEEAYLKERSWLNKEGGMDETAANVVHASCSKLAFEAEEEV